MKKKKPLPVGAKETQAERKARVSCGVKFRPSVFADRRRKRQDEAAWKE